MEIEISFPNIRLDGVEYRLQSWLEGIRHKYFYGDLIIKVDDSYELSSYEGLDQGGDEIAMWTRLIEDQDKVWFLPLVAWGDGWVAQKRVTQDEIKTRTSDGWKAISPIVEKYGLSGDVNPMKNWCVLESGQPVIYDYGCINTRNNRDEETL